MEKKQFLVLCVKFDVVFFKGLVAVTYFIESSIKFRRIRQVIHLASPNLPRVLLEKDRSQEQRQLVGVTPGISREISLA